MSVKNNFGWMLVGRGIFAASQWLVIIVIARISSLEKLGEYTFSLAIISPIIVFSQLNLRAFMSTDIKDQFSFSDYFVARLSTSVLAFLLIAIIVLLKDFTLSLTFLILSITIYKLIESISDLFYGIMQKHEKMSYISFSLVFHGVVALIGMTLTVYYLDSVFYGAIVTIFAWLVILFMYDIRVTNKIGNWSLSIWTYNKTWKVFKACFPLGIVMVLVSLRLNIPVYFIESNVGLVQVGYYSAVLYFLIAGNLIIGSLIQAAAPRLAQFYQKKDIKNTFRFIVKLMIVAGAIGLSGIATAIFFGDYILDIFYGEKFANLYYLLIWVISAGTIGILAQVMGLSLTVARLFRYQVAANIAGVIAVIAISYFLVPVYGVEGGAYAIFAGNTTVFLINTISVLVNKVITFSSYRSN